MRHFISLLTIVTFVFSGIAQISVTNTQTPNQLVQNVLMGFGVTASNITINGNPALANAVQTNVSYFNAAGTTFPINSGVLLTTGVGTVAAGPNNGGGVSLPGTPSVSTDPHLNDIAAGSVTNGVVLEFDFVPAGDTISFKYIFGSEEYPEFSPSTFNWVDFLLVAPI
jgi:hypothetical protein